MEVDHLALQQLTHDMDGLADGGGRLLAHDAGSAKPEMRAPKPRIARWLEISSSVAIAIAVSAG